MRVVCTEFAASGVSVPEGALEENHYQQWVFFPQPLITETFWQLLADRMDEWLRLQADQAHLIQAYKRMRRSGGCDSRPPLTEELWAAMFVFLLGHDEVSGKMDAAMSMEALCEIVVEYCLLALGVHIDATQVHDHVGQFFLAVVPPSLFGAHTVCRSRLIMEELIGVTLSKHLRAYMYARDFSLEPLDPPCTTAALLQELVLTRHELVRTKHSLAKDHAMGRVPEKTWSLVPHLKRGMEFNKFSRAFQQNASDPESAAEAAAVHAQGHIDTMSFVLECRLAFKHAPKTIVEADRLLRKLQGVPSAGVEQETRLDNINHSPSP